ncbi:hypothetical protein EDD29_5199 [Actinocorallia herbida]|uniref:TetR family transcriptional regulator n=1 Tax=Actinocorallia herbida TaxID=58109 RepID=A0A3N1D269_9ACTN|nr:hypothetical protein [Actinocorallia herbida]ROO87586.1 hypothetical protein EDD29_5199 [Actinocorallia herbida]
MAAFTPDAEGVTRWIDSYFAYCLDHPEVQGIWMQRRLSDAADLGDLESRFRTPTVSRSAELLKPAFQPNVDMHPAVSEMIWSIHCFLEGGVMAEEGKRLYADSPAVRRRFLTHLHKYVAWVAKP